MNFRQVNNQIKGKIHVKKPASINPDALTSNEIKRFIKNSYEYENRENNINGYILDGELSNRHAVIYHNPVNGRTTITHRGTEGNVGDWLNNAQYAIGNYENTKRFEIGKKTQERTAQKYGNENITTIGHSQGSILARKLGQKTKQIIQLNPALVDEAQLINEYIIRSTNDIVSAAKPVQNFFNRAFNPKQARMDGKKNRNIKPESNIIEEHLPDILDRMNDETIGVGIGGSYQSDKIARIYKYNRNKFDINKVKNPSSHLKNAFQPKPEPKQKYINIKDVPKNHEIYNYSNPEKLRKIADSKGFKKDTIYLSDKPNKKYMLFHPKTNKKIHFGQMGYQDLLYHNDELRRMRFKNRNKKWNDFDKYTPAYISYNLLW
jgi:hypothetical protein